MIKAGEVYGVSFVNGAMVSFYRKNNVYLVLAINNENTKHTVEFGSYQEAAKNFTEAQAGMLSG